MPKIQSREKLANTLLVLCSVIFALAVMEVGLRIIDFSYLTTWRFDRITGKSLLPGAQMWNTEEGNAFVQINSQGLRDEEHLIDKPENTLRIAILGDSYAEAIQVPVEQTFWNIAESDLAACPKLQGKTVEAINFGVSGFGTAQELLTLKHKVWKYSPDIVLLAFLSGNDIRNNLRELQRGGNQPYYVYQDGELVLDDRFLKKSKSRFMGSMLGDVWFAAVPRSRVLQLVVKFSNYVSQEVNGSERDERKNAQRLYERGLDTEIYSPPTDPVWVEAWKVTEDLIRMMNAEVKAHNATFMVVSLTNGPQVHPDQNERNEFANSLGVEDLLYPDTRIGRLASEENIRYLMLVPPLRAWAGDHGACVHGFENTDPCAGHWNAQGHALAGALIAEEVCTLLTEG